MLPVSLFDLLKSHTSFDSLILFHPYVMVQFKHGQTDFYFGFLFCET